MRTSVITGNGTLILRSLLIVCCGMAAGALAGGVYGTVCGGLHDAIAWSLDKLFSWAAGGALAGAGSGAIMGLFAAVDRLQEQASPGTRFVHVKPYSRAIVFLGRRPDARNERMKLTRTNAR